MSRLPIDEGVEPPGQPTERRSERWRSSGKPTPPDYFQARGVLQAGLDPLRLPLEDRPLTDAHLLHPGRAAQLVVEGKPAGWFGQMQMQPAMPV